MQDGKKQVTHFKAMNHYNSIARSRTFFRSSVVSRTHWGKLATRCYYFPASSFTTSKKTTGQQSTVWHSGEKCALLTQTASSEWPWSKHGLFHQGPATDLSRQFTGASIPAGLTLFHAPTLHESASQVGGCVFW